MFRLRVEARATRGVQKRSEGGLLCPPTVLAGSLGMALLLLPVGCGGSGGGGGSAVDTTAPITTAAPGGGTYGIGQTVRLTSNEAATIYYSVDGTDPDPGAAGTLSGSTPVTGIAVGGGTTVLKFFAIDVAANREATRTETYVVDLSAPTISLNGPAPDPVGLLATATVGWQTDEGGSYAVELGGTGTPGSGTVLSGGVVAAGTPMQQDVPGTRLAYGAVTSLWVYVTDGVGHTGSMSVALPLKPFEPVPTGAAVNIAVLPDGTKAYAVRRGADAVDVIDTDPDSATYDTVLTTVAVGTRPYGAAVTPDGARVYVTNQGDTNADADSISVIGTDTDAVVDTVPLGSATAPSGIAVTGDGSRAYFASGEAKVYVLDTNPASATFDTVTGNVPRALLLGGRVAATPDGTRVVVNWEGLIAHAIDVIDADPGSATYQQILASPVPVSVGLGGGVVVSPDSRYAYAGDTAEGLCGVCRIDLVSGDVEISGADFLALQDALALTPDGQVLLTGGVNTRALFVVNAADLTLRGAVDMGGPDHWTVRSIAVTPDGTRAYVSRIPPMAGSGDVVMVPLL